MRVLHAERDIFGNTLTIAQESRGRTDAETILDPKAREKEERGIEEQKPKYVPRRIPTKVPLGHCSVRREEVTLGGSERVQVLNEVSSEEWR